MQTPNEMPKRTPATIELGCEAALLLLKMQDRRLRIALNVDPQQRREINREIGLHAQVMEGLERMNLDAAAIPAQAIIADVAVGLAQQTLVTHDKRVLKIVEHADRSMASGHFRRELRVVK